MKKSALCAFLAAILSFGAPTVAAAAAPHGVPFYAYHVEVLVYHAFGSSADYTIPAKELDQEFQYLRRHDYDVLSQQQFLDYLDGTYVPKEPSVLLTFDDGPESFYTIAFPLLKKFHYHAVTFLIGSRIGVDKGTVTPAQVQTMARSGLIGFGAHTYHLHHYIHHQPALSEVTAPELMADIHKEDAIFKELGLPPAKLFAYPFGYHVPRLDRFLLNYYDALMTSHEGVTKPHTRIIPRVNLGSAYASIARVPSFLPYPGMQTAPATNPVATVPAAAAGAPGAEPAAEPAQDGNTVMAWYQAIWKPSYRNLRMTWLHAVKAIEMGWPLLRTGPR